MKTHTFEIHRRYTCKTTN